MDTRPDRPEAFLKKLSPFNRKKTMKGSSPSDFSDFEPGPQGWNQRCRVEVWPRGTWKLDTCPNLLEVVSTSGTGQGEIQGDIVVWQTLQDCADHEQGPSMGGSRHLLDISEHWMPSRASLQVVLLNAGDDIVQYIFAESQKPRHLRLQAGYPAMTGAGALHSRHHGPDPLDRSS